MKTSYLPSQQAARVTGDCSNLYCHSNGSGTFTRPNWGTPATGACGTCHATPPTSATHATFGAAANTCSTCHIYTDENGATHINGAIDKQAFLITEPHKNGNTLGSYSAAYITSKATCADCHNTNANNLAIRQQWEATGHAAVGSNAFKSSDFKTQASASNCPRCHTTTGFVRYTSARAGGSWGLAADTTKEVITCRACHSDAAAGIVRTVTPAKPFASYTAFRNAAMGISNVCADCHSGRDNGTRYVATLSNFSAAMSYKTHHMPAASTVQGVGGYSFPGRTYPVLADNSHGKVGTANANNTGTDGPCATCHMSATDKHSFAVTTANGTGAITSIKTSICTNCHSTSLPAATLDAKRLAFNNALDVLKAALADKGYVYDTPSKSFKRANGTNVFKWRNANTYGGGYNYQLFIEEGSAYTHNPEYARQIITDSIDAVYNNGTVTGDITAALADLLGRGKITQAQSDSLVAYKNPETSCGSCHGNPPNTDTHPKYVTAGTCATCHVYTGVNGATHNNGTVDLIPGGGNCDACHGYPPAPRRTITAVTFGVHGQWSSARFEDYSGGGGAHVIAAHINPGAKPSDGWAPCLTCHQGGSASHQRVLPMRNFVQNVSVKVDAKRRFNNGKLVTYSSASLVNGGANKTGRCFNAACHFQPSGKWSIER